MEKVQVRQGNILRNQEKGSINSMIASIGVCRSWKAADSNCKEVKCHGSRRSGKSREIMMGKYLLAYRIGCTSWGFGHDVTN